MFFFLSATDPICSHVKGISEYMGFQCFIVRLGMHQVETSESQVLIVRSGVHLDREQGTLRTQAYVLSHTAL